MIDQLGRFKPTQSLLRKLNQPSKEVVPVVEGSDGKVLTESQTLIDKMSAHTSKTPNSNKKGEQLPAQRL